MKDKSSVPDPFVAIMRKELGFFGHIRIRNIETTKDKLKLFCCAINLHKSRRYVVPAVLASYLSCILLTLALYYYVKPIEEKKTSQTGLLTPFLIVSGFAAIVICVCHTAAYVYAQNSGIKFNKDELWVYNNNPEFILLKENDAMTLLKIQFRSIINSLPNFFVVKYLYENIAKALIQKYLPESDYNEVTTDLSQKEKYKINHWLQKSLKNEDKKDFLNQCKRAFKTDIKTLKNDNPELFETLYGYLLPKTLVENCKVEQIELVVMK